MNQNFPIKNDISDNMNVSEIKGERERERGTRIVSCEYVSVKEMKRAANEFV
jgi:hypothetical protein